ncbi:hypothetical protein [Pseudomonas asiatica]|uniref:hypothetical protein n=1 Tax=Pseudomonas asiatica TaxID=2219225 RepID=UPI0037CBBC19
MKKLVPDPPHVFELPQGKSLSRAISEGIVPMEFALMNVTHYLMFAYSDSRRALERIQDEETRQLLEHGLRAMQIAWGRRMLWHWQLSVEASEVGLGVSRDSRDIN